MDTTEPKYDVVVELSDTDGNAYGILSKVRKALHRAGAPIEERDAFTEEAQSGDYDHLLQTCMKWVHVE